MTAELTPNLPFKLPSELHNISGLKLFEEQLSIACDDMIDARTRAAYHLHMILENELFLYIVETAEEHLSPVRGAILLSHRPMKKTITCFDDNGRIPFSMDGNLLRPNRDVVSEVTITYSYHTFPHQQDYLLDLSIRMGQGISTMKRNHSTLRMAKWLGYTMKDIAEIGIGILVTVSSSFSSDRETGEPIALKRGSLPEGISVSEYAKKIIKELAEKQGVLSRGDFFIESSNLTSPGQPRIWIEKSKRAWRKWCFEKYEGEKYTFHSGLMRVSIQEAGAAIVFLNDDSLGKVPDEAMDYFIRKLT